MRSPLHRSLLVAGLLVATCGPTLPAQGRDGYLNVESPQVSPIAHTTLQGPNGARRILVVCNTPDNSIELWDTDESLAPASRFLGRCWVGLEPVSVLVDGDRFWTANFLGDSVTAGRIEFVGGQPRARLLATRHIGDEPMDLTRLPHDGNDTLVVSLHSRSAVAWLDAGTLERYAPVVQDEILIAESRSTAQTTGDGARRGLKEPRAVRVVGGQVYALGMKGGVTDPQSLFDVDLLVGTVVPGTGMGTVTFDWAERLGGLGSTNFNMRASTAGDLYCVGGEAQNFTIDGLPGILAANSGITPNDTGFVRSTVYRVHRSGGALTVDRRDLNHTTTGSVVTAIAERAAQPTDVALLESDGVVTKLFVPAMGSDSIVVLARPTGGTADIATWARRVVHLDGTPFGGPQAPAQRFGPRGIVLGANQAGANRAYVLNRIDHSISIVDARNEVVVGHLPLANDPTPVHVKRGRHWLYDAKLSTSGFVSCASCHPDGRTDGLGWRLGDPNGVGIAFPPTPHDEILKLAGTGTLAEGQSSDGVSSPAFFVASWWTQTFDGANPVVAPNADDKREMVTQSLQGLLNWEVAPTAKPFFANAPYHWRGDRQSVQDFEEGFGNLLGLAPLSAAQKAEMEEFVLSISYPPNPKQDRTRTYPDGTLAAEGLELFHTRPSTLANRSCSTCHELPEGSNNRLTVLVIDAAIPGFIAATNRQSIESAALRGLFQKEPILEQGGRDLMTQDSIRVGHFGMNHNGIQPGTAALPSAQDPVGNLTTINTFIDVFFAQPSDPEAIRIKQFVHEMDWGVAPIVGHVQRVTQAQWPNFFAPPPSITFLTMLQQVHEANAGLVLWLETVGASPVRRGFRYFPNGTFFEEPSGAPFSLPAIHALMSAPDDSLTIVAVPLGSERRLASPTGTVTWPQQTFAGSVDLVGLHANTAYQKVPTFPGPGAVPPNTIAAPNGDAVPFGFGTGVLVTEVYADTIRRYQDALLNNPGGSYGLTGNRHEAPRRIRVRGNDIVPGAKLLLGVPDPKATPTSDPTTTPRITLELELFPTNEVQDGKRVWETAAELDPLQVYQLLLGGPTAPGVAEAVIDAVVSGYDLPQVEATFGAALSGLLGPFPSYPNPGAQPFDPDTWNTYPIQVRNPGPGGPADPTGPVSLQTWGTFVLDS